MSDFGSKPVKHMLVLSLTGSYSSGHSEAFTRLAYRPWSQTALWKRDIIPHCMNDPQPEGHMASYIRRRKFLASLLGGVAVAWPLAARAQQRTTKVPRIGWLVTGSPTSYRFSLAAFRDGLKALGHVEGQNISIEYRWAEGNVAELPELAKDLVHQKVDIILAGGSVGAEAAKRATSVIPIIAAGVGDLVELGLVTSLARPDGNLTGFVAAAPETAAKRFQLIKENKPAARRAAVLWNSASSNAKL